MAVLTDRLDFVIGGSNARKLEEHFGIRTVNDLLRHYPRKYNEGLTVRGEGEALDLEEGEHVTFVDVITDTKVGEMKPQFDKKTKRMRKRKWLRVTLGEHRPKVTATFFNADWMIDKLPTDTRIMLSGEVKYFKGAMQLTHPAFLVLKSPSGKEIGTKSLKTIADASGATGDELLSAFEREFFPIYAADAKVQSWDIYACVRQVLDVLDPVDEPLPKSFVQQANLISEDEALRDIHLAESESERERARQRLTYDEAVGLQWALVARRHGDLSESGPAAPRKDNGLLSALMEQLPFELTTGQREVLDILSTELAATRPMNRMLQGEVGSGKTIVSVLAMLQMIDAGYQCALLAPTEVLAAQHARSVRDVLGPLAMAGQLGGAENATRLALLTGSMSPQQKKQVRDEVASGEAGIVIGTHALLQDAVDFKRLGMVVVDEQHSSVSNSETGCAPRPPEV
jgi:ATP-dependent DNA helicase RecG